MHVTVCILAARRSVKRLINALQSFPLAAWDDISAAPLNPEMVKAARQLEIRYAEQKPAWEKIPRATAKQKGWKKH